ncbi:MAG TPA: hypothetical protein V6D19_06580 [Stenomitos sp.]
MTPNIQKKQTDVISMLDLKSEQKADFTASSVPMGRTAPLMHTLSSFQPFEWALRSGTIYGQNMNRCTGVKADKELCRSFYAYNFITKQNKNPTEKAAAAIATQCRKLTLLLS